MLALLHLQRFNDAAQVFSDVLAMDPRVVAARVNLGTALASLGRYDEAVRTLTQAAQMESDPDGRRSIIGIIDEIEAARGSSAARPALSGAAR